MNRDNQETHQQCEVTPRDLGDANPPSGNDDVITERDNGNSVPSEEDYSGTVSIDSIHSDSDSNYSPSQDLDSNTSSIEYEASSSPLAQEEVLEIIVGSNNVTQRSSSTEHTWSVKRGCSGLRCPDAESSDDEEDHPNLAVAYSQDLAEFAKRYPCPSTRQRVPDSMNASTSGSGVATPKRIRGKVYCFYCEEQVLHFARHIQRHHANELEVQRIMSMKKQSKERKRLLYAIRTKGNYLLSKQTGQSKPVRTPITNRESTQPLPCKHCYGFFARKHLWRHMRSCPCKPGTSGQSKGARLNIAQNMTLSQVHGNDYLLTHVFPRMHADQVTKAVKADPLICSFGARFAQIHQEKHQVNVVSRKMREMGKLLIELNADLAEHTALIDLLRPQNFDKIVQAVKNIAKYNPLTKQFGSPSYAMNISTSIKECCEIACNFIRKQGIYNNKADQEAAEFPFRSLVSLITSDWKFEISHNAHNDLAKSSMNKVTIVPLARDLRKLKDYLMEAGDEAFKKLEVDPNNDVAFKNLVESVYCRVMLLCRKRCGELARLPVDLYLRTEERQSYEEFADVLTHAEAILARRFRRLLVLGKRRPTAVLFSETVQQHISLILKVRQNFVRTTNEYLFATGPGIGTLIGHRVITKLAHRAGLDRPEAITTRALRKHLATVCQVLAMTDQDIEQLAAFMGHTGGIHRSEYRLPDSIFQTAKVSKLLLMMESGDAAKYKGKTLDEIDLDMEEDLLADPDTTFQDFDDSLAMDCPPSTATAINDYEVSRTIIQPVASTSTAGLSDHQSNLWEAVGQPPRDISFDGVPTSTPKKTGKRTHIIRERWTDEQKRVVKTFFAQHIQQRKAPKRFECEHLISTHEVLRNKPWTKIKVYVVNEYNKKKAK